MVRPASFGFNSETAVTNHFQNHVADTDTGHMKVQDEAAREFDAAVQTLRENSIAVTVFQDTDIPTKPDAIFPNNWISLHESGEVILYPMATPNRRTERRNDIVQHFKQKYQVDKVLDLSHHEVNGLYLEGTGSIVFDHTYKVAYAATSVRTHQVVLRELCEELGYTQCIVNATDQQDRDIYHTNVFLSIGHDIAVVCLDVVKDKEEQLMLFNNLVNTGRQVIDVTMDQMGSLAANCLEVMGGDGGRKFVISSRGWISLNRKQKDVIEEHCDVVICGVDTIEEVGGGGIRCMMAGIHCVSRGPL